MDSINYNLMGTVFDIQRFSLHDGPGIRTIVFLKGCPLSCQWCSNPESQSIKPVIMYKEDDCLHCGRCITACKRGAISPENKPGLTESCAVDAANVSMHVRQALGAERKDNVDPAGNPGTEKGCHNLQTFRRRHHFIRR